MGRRIEHTGDDMTAIASAFTSEGFVIGADGRQLDSGDSDEIDRCFRGHFDHSFRGHADQDRSEATLAFVILEK
jgi:hypothetical protein